MSSATTEAACLRFPLAAYPGFNRFTLDWMAGNPNATKFLPRDVIRRRDCRPTR